jgi:hypothetical protein
MIPVYVLYVFAGFRFNFGGVTDLEDIDKRVFKTVLKNRIIQWSVKMAYGVRIKLR